MLQEQIEAIRTLCPHIVIKENEILSTHTSFRVGGPADLWIEPDCEALPVILGYCREHVIPITILGNGSNVLVSDAGIRGVVLCIGEKMAHIRVEGTKIYAEAGALLSQVANVAAQEGLSGLEFASGIPGSIGGAVLMNAGAYDGQMKDVIESASFLDTSLVVQVCKRQDMDLSYRHSRFMEEEAVITEAVLSLTPANSEEIYARMKELNVRRKEKQPLEYPSAGSTFKRPKDHFAGKLIMDAGLADYAVGGARVSSKHCGFIINDGHADASDIYHLMREVVAQVKETSGITLEPEVRLLGEF